MQIERSLPDGKTKFIMEAGSPKEAFSKLALVDSLFTESCCGCCDSKNICFAERKVENGSYLEMRCRDCNAQLDYGQNKDGKSIFAKKWDSENKCALPNNGWHVWKKDGGDAPKKAQKPQTTPEQDANEIPFSWLLPFAMASLSMIC